MPQPWASLALRVAMTAAAFWWVSRMADFDALRAAFSSASRGWLAAAVLLFFAAQLLCVVRWKLLAPAHPSVTARFLTRSFFVASFFNTFLPTTVGGDVIRSYDLIKATGQWRESLASVLTDRLCGMSALAAIALAAWAAFPPARQDPVVNAGFAAFCLVVAGTFGVLGSRRALRASLKPFGKIGLGQLESHAKQFQESLLAYLRRPRTLAAAFASALAIQALGIGMVVAAANALHLNAPLLFLVLVTPMIVTVSQLPISLSGWGVREGATIVLLGRIGVEAPAALSLSIVCGAMPLLAGAVGGLLFLTRRQRKRRPSET